MKFKRILKGPKVNRVVKYFVFADLLFFAGLGFIAPIFSIFIIEDIEGATLLVVGISAAIYWVARSLVQPIIANVIDKKKGEKDDLYVLILGLALTGVVLPIFAFIETITHLYILQIFHGVAFGMYSTSWLVIFSRHLDKKRQAFDWSLDNAAVGLAIAFTSLVGGWLAGSFGFDVAFIIGGVLAIASAFVIFLVPDLILPQPHKSILGTKSHKHRLPIIH